MVIISKTILNQFGLQHGDSLTALNEWYAVVKAADWKNLADIKQTFNSADFVGNDRYVFNVRGNRYRIVVLIFFDKRTLFIRFVGTHAEYDKVDCSIV